MSGTRFGFRNWDFGLSIRPLHLLSWLCEGMIIFVPRAGGDWPQECRPQGTHGHKPPVVSDFDIRISFFFVYKGPWATHGNGSVRPTELKGKWTKGRSKKRRWHRFPEFHFPFPFVKVCLGTPCKPCSGTTRSSVSSDAIARYRVGHDGRHSRLCATAMQFGQPLFGADYARLCRARQLGKGNKVFLDRGAIPLAAIAKAGPTWPRSSMCSASMDRARASRRPPSHHKPLSRISHNVLSRSLHETCLPVSNREGL